MVYEIKFSKEQGTFDDNRNMANFDEDENEKHEGPCSVVFRIRRLGQPCSQEIV